MEDPIRARLQQAIGEKVFPGAVLGVVRTDGQRLIIAEGRFTYEPGSPQVEEGTQYDVASITKSIPTGCLALKLIEEGKLSLDDRLVAHLPEYASDYREAVLIRHLLTYSVILDFPVPGFSIQTATPEDVRRNLLTTGLRFPPGSVAQYSNSPALLLAMAIERITGSTLDALARRHFFEPLGMERSVFKPERKEAIPPTEIDEWRGLVQGSVHDETSFVLEREGVSGCAGLFSNVPDILTFLGMLLNKGECGGRRYFQEETVAEMHTNQLPDIGASMGLGWELNEPKFMGAHALPSTFGKTGFTGTVCVADPERGVAYVLLANRTYPKRSSADAIQAVRRDLSDMVLTSHG